MPSKAVDRRGRVWDREIAYGELLYRRAIGELPEMESSKAIARVLAGSVRPGDRILDVGCGAGHYLRSLLSTIPVPFTYTGVDATPAYVELARHAWSEEPRASFHAGEAEELPFDDRSFDIVMSNNVLQHLPAIKKPLHEIARVSKRLGIARMLVGNRSFRIQEVYSFETHPQSFVGQASDEEFDAAGDPKSFHYFNIYSKTYVRKIASGIDGVECEIEEDRQYDPAAIKAAMAQYPNPDTTTMLGDWQVNGYILQPWCFVKLHKTEGFENT